LVEQLLLVLQVAFVVLLYLFIWRVVRVASKDMTAGQESMILTPARPREEVRRASGRLVVTESPEIATGTVLEIARELLAGRDANGTYVNGERLNGTRYLQQGDVITIGQTQLAYEGAA
jgi:hypothetical protein